MMKADIRGAVAKLERVRRAAQPVAQGALRELAQFIARYMAYQPHQDTRRFSRAFIEACHEIGAKGVAIPTVGVSRYWRDLYLAVKRFRDQQRARVQDLERDIILMFPKPPKSPTRGLYGKKMRELARAKELLRKSQRMLEAIGSDPRAIVIHAGKGAVFGGTKESTRPPQVVTRIYGGEGRMQVTPQGAAVILRNLEAHARIVEKQYRLAGAVKKVLGPMAVKIADKKLRDAVRKVGKAG